MNFKNLFLVKIFSILLIGVFVTLVINPGTLLINLDGKEIEYETNKVFVSRLNDTDSKIKSDSVVLTNKDEVDINTLKNITINYNGKDEKYQTYQSNLSTFLIEETDMDKLSDNQEIEIEDYANNQKLFDNQEIKINKYDVSYYEEEETKQEVQYVNDDTLEEGFSVILQEGEESTVTNTHKVRQQSGKEISDEIIAEKVTKEGTPRIIRVGTKYVATVDIDTSGDGGVWDEVAACESGGNWAINTKNGYYGGLQIAKGTWDAYASSVGVSAEYPHQADKMDQIKVAEQILANQGWNAWGNCKPSSVE